MHYWSKPDVQFDLRKAVNDFRVQQRDEAEAAAQVRAEREAAKLYCWQEALRDRIDKLLPVEIKGELQNLRIEPGEYFARGLFYQPWAGYPVELHIYVLSHRLNKGNGPKTAPLVLSAMKENTDYPLRSIPTNCYTAELRIPESGSAEERLHQFVVFFYDLSVYMRQWMVWDAEQQRKEDAALAQQAEAMKIIARRRAEVEAEAFTWPTGLAITLYRWQYISAPGNEHTEPQYNTCWSLNDTLFDGWLERIDVWPAVRLIPEVHMPVCERFVLTGWSDIQKAGLSAGRRQITVYEVIRKAAPFNGVFLSLAAEDEDAYNCYQFEGPEEPVKWLRALVEMNK